MRKGEREICFFPALYSSYGARGAAPSTFARARVRARVLEHHPPAWLEIAEIRGRVEKERRTPAGALSLKTGPGGLMDVDFLAGGALLERPPAAYPEIPSGPAMLRAAHPGAASEALLADYTLLRRVEAAARWAAGRAVDRNGSGP